MELLDYTFIVFGEEHHYNPLGVVRSLGEYGIYPIVVAYGGRLRVVSRSKYIKADFHVRSIKDGYELIISKFKDSNMKSFIITCDDRTTEYLDQRYDLIKDYFYFGNAGKNGGITYYLNKNNMNILAKKHGLKIPGGFVVRRGEFRDQFEYPVITKAISSNAGAWKKDVFVCKDRKELEEAYKQIESDTLLVQRFIEKENELCIDGYSINNGESVFFTIASTYNYNIPGKYAYDYISVNFNDENLGKVISSIIKEIGYEGIFCIEFLIDKNGDKYFMEINFRNSGWSYTSTCAGMNMPVQWAQSMLLGRIVPDAYHLIKKDFRSIVEFADFRTRVIGRQLGIREWFKLIKSADCLLVFNKADNKPFWTVFFDKFNRFNKR